MSTKRSGVITASPLDSSSQDENPGKANNWASVRSSVEFAEWSAQRLPHETPHCSSHVSRFQDFLSGSIIEIMLRTPSSYCGETETISFSSGVLFCKGESCLKFVTTFS